MIKIETADWLFNSGLIGFINILKFNDDKVKINQHSIEVDESVLDGFEEKYFDFFADKYEAFTGWYRIVSYQSVIDDFREKDSFTEEDVDSFNEYKKFLDTKLTSNSYTKTYAHIEDKSVDLLAEVKKISEIKLTKKRTINDVQEDFANQLDVVEKIIEYVEKEEVKKYLIAKDIAYNVINNFWNDKSFLHKQKSEVDIYKEFNDSFVQPTLQYIDMDKTKAKYSCVNCDSKMPNLKSAFNMTFLQNIGIDGEKKTSYFWNLNRTDYTCPICNLIYSCVPAGFTFLKGNGLFINNNTNVETLISSNNQVIKSSDNIMELEYRSYLKIAEAFNSYNIRNIKNEYENIQVVKLDTSNKFRAYTFNTLSKDMVRFLADNEKQLKFLLGKRVYWYSDKNGKKFYKYLYKEVIDSVYRGQNLFSLIDFSLNRIIREEFDGLDEVALLLKFNVDLIKIGGNDMENMNSKKVYAVRCMGNELKNAYKSRGAENKIEGVLYRLLNAVKVKDSGKFLDTVISAYSYIGKEIPLVFIDCLSADSKMFQTVGYAFILGLKGEDKKEENKDDKGEVK